MELKIQRRLASSIMKCSPKRVKFSVDKLKEIKEAITRGDIRGLIIDKLIVKQAIVGTSNTNSNKIKIQKRKGRQRGHGSRKGTAKARLNKKEAWIGRIRRQREFIKVLKEKELVPQNVAKALYRKSKGGFFRSKRHIQLYLSENNLIKTKEN
jgi:large subunit ribosomal protein L19e